MGLGKTLQSLITVALITLELSVMKDSVQQNSKSNQINNNNKINNENKTNNDINSISSVTGGRSLVICPASLALHWEGEIKKFFPYGNLLISELYNSNTNNNTGSNSGNNDGNNSGNNDGNNSSKYSNDNNNKHNINKNDKMCLESDPSSSVSPSVVVVASYDSVRKNNNNYFTNQVRFISYVYFISCFLVFLFSCFLVFLFSCCLIFLF